MTQSSLTTNVVQGAYPLATTRYEMGEVTCILSSIASREDVPPQDLLPLIYTELRMLAAQKLSLEHPGNTLQATALVHEAWLRLMRDAGQSWESRGHFFAAAAEAMRRILIESARRKKRLRHGGGWQRVELEDFHIACEIPCEQLLALEEALRSLESLDSFGASVVKLRFFGGLTHPQIAKVLNTSLSTVERSWAFCRVWLFQRIQSC